MGSGLAKHGLKKDTYVCNESEESNGCAESTGVNQEGDGNNVTTKPNATKLAHAASDNEINGTHNGQQHVPTESTQSESDLTKRVDSACANNPCFHSEFFVKNHSTNRSTPSNETLNSNYYPIKEYDNDNSCGAVSGWTIPNNICNDSIERAGKSNGKPKRLNTINQDNIKKKQIKHLNEWREITLKQHNDLTDHEKMQRVEEIKRKDRGPISPTPYSGHLEPITLPKVVKPRKPLVSSDDEDFIDTLDWDLSKDDADFVSRGAQKYLDYAAMGKMAKKIKQREDALKSKMPAQYKVNDRDVSVTTAGKSIISCENSDSVQVVSGDKHPQDSNNMTDSEKHEIQSNIQAEILNQLGQVEKLIFDLELL